MSSNSVVAAAAPSCTDTTAAMTRSGAAPNAPAGSDRSLIPDHLDHQALGAASVKLAVEDRLPWTQVQPPVGDRQHNLLVRQQVLQVRVAVVLSPSVMTVVPALREQLPGDLVGGLFPARRSQLVEPLQRVRLDPRLVV